MYDLHPSVIRCLIFSIWDLLCGVCGGMHYLNYSALNRVDLQYCLNTKPLVESVILKEQGASWFQLSSPIDVCVGVCMSK